MHDWNLHAYKSVPECDSAHCEVLDAVLTAIGLLALHLPPLQLSEPNKLLSEWGLQGLSAEASHFSCSCLPQAEQPDLIGM